MEDELDIEQLNDLALKRLLEVVENLEPADPESPMWYDGYWMKVKDFIKYMEDKKQGEKNDYF